MSALPLIEPATATGDTATALAEVKKALGAVPNLTKVMANSPAVVRAWLALNRTLDAGVLPPAVRERLAIATAEYNGCEYCLSAHMFLGKRVAKLDSAELEAARDAKSSDPHVADLLALSDTIVRGHGIVDDSVLDEARAAGVTDAEIAEIVAHISLNTFTNYLNNLAHTDVDYPVVVRPRSRV